MLLQPMMLLLPPHLTIWAGAAAKVPAAPNATATATIACDFAAAAYNITAENPN